MLALAASAVAAISASKFRMPHLEPV
jgi:hypothetical protein